MASTLGFHLPLPDHRHYFDAGQDDAGATKILEAQHRSGDAFDGPMVLSTTLIRFVHPPALAHRPLVTAKRLLEQRHRFNHPAMHR